MHPQHPFVSETHQNLEQNICRLFHVLAQFLFTTRETELDFLTTEVMDQLFHGFLKDLRFRILGNLEITKKSLKALNMMASTPPTTKKPNFYVFGKIMQKIGCKKFNR